MSENRKIRFRGEEIGILSIKKIDRMATRGELDHAADFWSERALEWMPLEGIIFDLQPSNLDDLKSSGITRVEIIGSGMNDCPVCEAIQGRDYPIAEVPMLPHPGCMCVPWSRCTEIAKA